MNHAEIVNNLTELNMHLHVLTSENKRLLKVHFMLPIDTLFVMQGEHIVHIGNMHTLSGFIYRAINANLNEANK